MLKFSTWTLSFTTCFALNTKNYETMANGVLIDGEKKTILMV